MSGRDRLRVAVVFVAAVAAVTALGAISPAPPEPAGAPPEVRALVGENEGLRELHRASSSTSTSTSTSTTVVPPATVQRTTTSRASRSRSVAVNVDGDRFEALAACESTGDRDGRPPHRINPSAVSPSGRYRGAFQFDRPTWAGVGGTGDPAAAPYAEQRARAVELYRQRGAQPWPICGRLL